MNNKELCLKTIALFVHDELTSTQFTDIFFESTELFAHGNVKNILGENLYYDIIDTNFNVKEQCITIKTKMADFLKEKYSSLYDIISDSYVEKIVEKNNNDILTKILAKRYIKPQVAVINFSGVASSKEFILKIRDTLDFPLSCTNWDSINDMIYDVMFPKKIILKNCGDVSRTFSGDFENLEDLLKKKRGIENNTFEVEYC